MSYYTPDIKKVLASQKSLKEYEENIGALKALGVGKDN